MAVALSPIHVIGVVASVALLYQSYRLARSHKEGLFEFLLWTGFGVALLVLSVGSALTSVDVLQIIENGLALLGFNVGRDSVFYVSNLLLLFLVFYMYTLVAESRQQLSDLNQELALLRYEMERDASGDRDHSED